VSKRCAIILVRNEDTNTLYIEDNGNVETFKNRDEARDYIVNNQDALIERFGINAIYEIALLDWRISFKKSDIKIVIN